MLWYEKQNSDIAVSTRIRLARNLKNVPFPNAMTADEKKKTVKKIADSILNGNSVLAKDFELVELDFLAPLDRQLLAEQHLISPAMLEGNGHAVLLNKDRTISIMLMEEDHIRLQTILPGFDLNEAWNLANKVDDVIEENLEYAFDSEFGYLTSCPTNTGTGLRASVMLHLPALEMTNQLQRIVNSSTKLGIAVRGLYGEGTEIQGSLLQFSNQITMGASENEIIAKLENIVNQIINHEKDAREHLKKNNYDALADKLWRSYGTLKYARSITSAEAKELLSDVRLAQNMGIITDSKINTTELEVDTEPASIMKQAGKNLNPAERDRQRAEIIRNRV